MGCSTRLDEPCCEQAIKHIFFDQLGRFAIHQIDFVIVENIPGCEGLI